MSPDQRSTTAARAAVMPEVMDALTGAVARRRAASRRRRWLGRGSALSVGLALVSGTALAATGQWNPFAGSADHKAYSLAPAPAADMNTLAVLRRPQTALDRSELIVDFLKRTQVVGPSKLVYLPSIRFLRNVGDTTMGGWDGTWHRQTRPGVLVLMPSEVVEPVPLDSPHASAAAKRAAAAKQPQHAICLWTISDGWPAGAAPPMQPPSRPGRPAVTPTRPPLLKDRVQGGGTCVSLHQLRTTGVIEGLFNWGALTGVVPDGVAAVRITTRTGVVMTDKVVNNSFQLLAPGREKLVRTTMPGGRIRTDMPALSAQFRHQTLQWLAADGRVIRHVPR